MRRSATSSRLGHTFRAGDRPVGGWRDLGGPLLAGTTLTFACWAIICFTPILDKWLFGDAKLYYNWGTLVASHDVPYRDFRIEYPPGAVPAFALPIYLRKLFGYYSDYYFWFRVEIVVASALALVCMAYALLKLGASRRRAYGALCVAGIAPLVLGPIDFFHYDAVPALFTVAAVAALLGGRGLLACALAAAGTVVKVYPAVLIPLALIELWRRGRWRAVGAGIATAVVVIGVVIVPFGVIGPHGVAWALHRQASRPLQVESLGANLIAIEHTIAGTHLLTVQSVGSRNLAGPGQHVVGVASSLLLLAALVGIYWLYLRSRRGGEELVVAAAATVTAYIGFGTVFSPQYVAWLIPLVPLVGGRIGVRANVLFVAILGLTQFWEPYRYETYYRFTSSWLTWLVLGRNLVVLALLGVLVAGLLGRERAVTREPLAVGLDLNVPGRP